jgi:hypothetical protein
VGSSVSALIYMVPAKIKTRRTSPIQNRAFLQFRGALIGERVNCGQKGILIPSCQSPHVLLAMSGILGY